MNDRPANTHLSRHADALQGYPTTTEALSALPVANAALVTVAGAVSTARTSTPGASVALDHTGRISDMLALVAGLLPIKRRMLHAGEVLYAAGEPFDCLHVVNAGLFKIVNTTADGRNQVVGLQFRGDWLGFDGIVLGRYGCEAVALDTGEAWAVRYDALLGACTGHPALLSGLLTEMSRAITRGRDSMLSRCTLTAAARVADFLRYWTESLARRGMRTDQITLRMSRAEIGNYLGMTLESVSRALSGLERYKAISFTEKGRREILIPDLRALTDFIQGESVSLGHEPGAGRSRPKSPSAAGRDSQTRAAPDGLQALAGGLSA